jgi:carbamoyltransferase
MLILGFNAYHGDVAAALLDDGRVVAAVEEERFRRVKHYAGYPQLAIDACLRMAGAQGSDVDAFAVPRARRAHLFRKALYALRGGAHPRLFGAHRASSTRREALLTRVASHLALDVADVGRRSHFIEHHRAHLASAYHASGFDEAAVCAIDGFGDFVSTSIGRGRAGRLDMLDRVFFPHSLGILYSAVTQHLGFMHYGDEYKVMGLAPYGRPTMAREVGRLLRLGARGRFELELKYFQHQDGSVSFDFTDGEPRMERILSAAATEVLGPAREPGAPLEARHEALAASMQHVFEEAYFHVLDEVARRVPSSAICLAGGCAMNSVANGKVRGRTRFTSIYVQPAAGDNGTALGAALDVWHRTGAPKPGVPMRHAYWGTAYTDDDMRDVLAGAADTFVHCRRREFADHAALCDWTATQLAAGRIVGWFQGRMEWAARALGNRSILADPRRVEMREVINRKIKLRERFRPFAPSITEEAVDTFFVDALPDPFMTQVYPIRPEKLSQLAAVAHVDGTGRLQAVSRETNPLYWQLLDAFGRLTGVPVLLNTSFNENEPIVERPVQALDCFLRTDMDVLVLGSSVLEKR